MSLSSGLPDSIAFTDRVFASEIAATAKAAPTRRISFEVAATAEAATARSVSC
jgi:hypothetical protein